MVIKQMHYCMFHIISNAKVSAACYRTYLRVQARTCRCPRFILHCRSEEEALSSHPQPPSLSRPHSTTPVVFPHQAVSCNSARSLTPNYSGAATPFTPSRTPTFKRLPSSPHRRSKSHGNATPTSRDHVKGRLLAAGTDDVGAARHHELTTRPHTVTGSRQHTSPYVDSGRCPSRKVWDKQNAIEGAGTPNETTGSVKKISSPSRKSQRAKYTLQHLRDPHSRCASSQSLVCKAIYIVHVHVLASSARQLVFTYFTMSCV